MDKDQNDAKSRRRRRRSPRRKKTQDAVVETTAEAPEQAVEPQTDEPSKDASNGESPAPRKRRSRSSRSRRGGRSRSRSRRTKAESEAPQANDQPTDNEAPAADPKVDTPEPQDQETAADAAEQVESAGDDGNGRKPSRSKSRRSRRGRRGGKRSRRSRGSEQQTSEATNDEPTAETEQPVQTQEESSAQTDSSPIDDDVDEVTEEDASRRKSDRRSNGRLRRRRTSSRNRRRREDVEARGEMGDEDTRSAEDEESSVNKIMLINCVEEQEARIAVVTDNKLEQLHQERTAIGHIVGNIHKGIVVNLVPNIEAAFVEFGYRKHGFLHISDILPSAVGASGRSDDIRDLLKEGQEITIQVTKEGIGDKGPSLTTYLSLPGRYMVLMPGLQRKGVSRRIANEEERGRIRRILADLDMPSGVGIIARTAAEGRSPKDLQRDLDYLLRLWHAICERSDHSKPPCMVYQESDPVTRVIRDVFTEETRKVVVDSEDVFEKVKEFMRVVLPRHVRKVKLHGGSDPLFHHYGVEDEIDMMHSRSVPLPNGGSIVIDQTEAMVTIDINSGHYKGRGDAEETAYQINMAAAGEIARQIRLRDLGGVIAIDFIDMEEQRHRSEVERTLWNAFKDDRARMRMLKMSAFCIVELTRQRQRQSLRQSAYEACPCCRGTGLIKSHETLALQALRQMKAGLDRQNLKNVELSVSPDVANYMNNHMRARIGEIETETGKNIHILANDDIGPGVHQIRFLDSNGRELTKR